MDDIRPGQITKYYQTMLVLSMLGPLLLSPIINGNVLCK